MSAFDSAPRPVVDKIRAAVPGAIEEMVEFRGELTLLVGRERLLEVGRVLRDDPDLQFDLLEDIVADDMLPELPRFAVSYHLYSIPKNQRVRLRVTIADPDEGPPSLAGLWPTATWLEMEVWDLMGIVFQGNDSLRRLFMPEDWQGFPLRKDYPMGYEEVQYSFNWRAIDAKKPYAKD